MLAEHERHGADRADVLRDVVAADAVAARGGQHELAAFVAEVDGDAVDFRIDDVAAGDRESRRSSASASSFVAFLAAAFFGSAAVFVGVGAFVELGAASGRRLRTRGRPICGVDSTS